MEKIIVFCLICFGMTNIITMSKLFKPVRDSFGLWKEKAGVFLHCPMCVGFWTGLFWSLLGFGIIGNGLFKIVNLSWMDLTKSFADACISSGVCWVLYVLCCAVAGPEYEKL